MGDEQKRDDAGERVVAEVGRLLRLARSRGASDLHFEPDAEGLHVRLRLDGVLHETEVLPPALARPVVARLKFLADLMTWRSEVPQEGRLRSDDVDGLGDLRVSTFPTIHGERAVVRFFDSRQGGFALDTLGLPADVISELRQALSATSGVVLLTGPAGSGKTTTLYACIAEFLAAAGPVVGARHASPASGDAGVCAGRATHASPLHQVITVEDPVEAVLPGVTQTQVNPAAGLTYATALRSLLRQDPEVLMVGEIRDRETADVALHAGLTGHLVLSTLHGGDVPSVITRLLDMSIEPYVVTSALRAVMAMRLVRRVCDKCRGENSASACDACGGTGYRGRLPIVEFAHISGELKNLILASADGEALRRQLARENIRMLRQRADEAVAAGLTSAAEIQRVLGPV